MLALSLLEPFLGPGAEALLVQKKGEIRDYLDVAWSIQIVRGLLLGAILVLAAPYIASFFSVPEARSIIQLIAVVPVVRGFLNPGLVYFQRELQFHKQFRYEITSNIVQTVVSVTAALVFRNVWALILGLLAGEIAALIFSYIYHPYRPRTKLDWDKAKDLFMFGRWVYLRNILNAVSGQAIGAILLRLLGPASLGLFVVARRISYAPVAEVGNRVVFWVAFPIFSKMQDDKPRLTEGFLRSLEIVNSVTLPVAIAFFFVAEGLVPYILGDQWIPSIPAIRILGFAGAAVTINALCRALFYGTGHPEISLRINLVGVFLLLVSVYPLARNMGITGAALAVVIATLGTIPFQFKYLMSLVGFSYLDVMKAALPGIGVSIGLALVLTLCRQLIGQGNVFLFILTIIIAIVFYVLIITLIWVLWKTGPLRVLTIIAERREDVQSTS